MTFYRDHVLPHLIALAMRNRTLVPYRERVVSEATGRILELGIGSGLNLPLYGRNASEIIGLEPSPRLIAMATRRARKMGIPVTFIESSAEAIPIQDRSIDTVVMTWTLCSIPNVLGALSEMRRVLKLGGKLLFVEHGLAPEPGVRRWQGILTPFWRRIAGGCHLNRPIQNLIETAGFSVIRLKTGYSPGPKPLTYMYEGCALA